MLNKITILKITAMLFPMLNIYKDVKADLKKSEIVYKFKCHCESVYIAIVKDFI